MKNQRVIKDYGKKGTFKLMYQEGVHLNKMYHNQRTLVKKGKSRGKDKTN